nr:MAG TPA: hypothetical protein [Caudoviricetes sp.]DAZ48996.1 MAG TPA: hypothetical protein [Caudoviricetes sp.]
MSVDKGIWLTTLISCSFAEYFTNPLLNQTHCSSFLFSLLITPLAVNLGLPRLLSLLLSHTIIF